MLRSLNDLLFGSNEELCKTMRLAAYLAQLGRSLKATIFATISKAIAGEIAVRMPPSYGASPSH